MSDPSSALDVARAVRGQHRRLVEEMLREAPLRSNVSHVSRDFDEFVRAALISDADRAVLDDVLSAVNVYLGAPERDPVLGRLVAALTSSYDELSGRAEVSPLALAIAGAALDSAETAADEAQRRDDPDRGGGGEAPGGGGGGGVGVGDTTLVVDFLGAVAGGKAGLVLGGPLGAALGAFAGSVVGSVFTAEWRRLAGVPG